MTMKSKVAIVLVILSMVEAGEAIWLTLPPTGTKCVSEEIQNNVIVLGDYVVVPDDHSHSSTISIKVISLPTPRFIFLFLFLVYLFIYLGIMLFLLVVLLRKLKKRNQKKITLRYGIS